MKRESILVRITACELMNLSRFEKPKDPPPLRNDVLYWLVHTHLFNTLFGFYCSDAQYYSPAGIVIK